MKFTCGAHFFLPLEKNGSHVYIYNGVPKYEKLGVGLGVHLVRKFESDSHSMMKHQTYSIFIRFFSTSTIFKVWFTVRNKTFS